MDALCILVWWYTVVTYAPYDINVKAYIHCTAGHCSSRLYMIQVYGLIWLSIVYSIYIVYKYEYKYGMNV